MSDGYYNILLFGVDSGDGCDLMCFDSIFVVLVNVDIGVVMIIGILCEFLNVLFSDGSLM